MTNAACTLLALALTALVSLSPPDALAQTSPADPPSAEHNRATVATAFERWAAGGTGFFDELLSPDVMWTIEGSSPSAGTYAGREDLIARAVRPFAARLSAPLRPVATRIFADGDHVIVHWRGEGTAADGAPYANSYAWILRMRDGKAVEVTAFLDLAPYDDVLRRIPAPVR